MSEFLDYSQFFCNNKKTIFWTLHDLSSFTGGCHYSNGCKKFQIDCSKCPLPKGSKNENISKSFLKIKMKAIKKYLNLEILCPSKWIEQQSTNNSIFKNFKHLNIPNGFDRKNFKPYKKDYERKILKLPTDKKIILFISESILNKRKDFSYLQQALNMYQNKDNLSYCAIGSLQQDLELKNIISFGKIEDENILALTYSAAYIFVLPSLEDNLPIHLLRSLCVEIRLLDFQLGGSKI